MDRRTFVQATAATTGLALLGSLHLSSFAAAADTPYGPLGAADANGVQLPPGFTSRVVATTGSAVAATGHVWHPNPDGGATFAQPDGGWVYVSNDEAGGGNGGAGMIRFDAAGQVVGAGSILTGTSRNCAGGPMPWGTWLSCEEFAQGRVWECDPLGIVPAQVRPAMGVFNHEAAAADPVRQVIYLTEDRGDGGLYRFVPASWGDLSSGVLEVMTESAGALGWATVPDPSAAVTETRHQVPAMKQFAGGEGAWFDGQVLYFTTKGDNRVWCFDPLTNALTVVYHLATSPDPLLSGVDNVTVAESGDIYVCEDGGNMEIVMLTPEGTVAPFLRLGVSGSELTGVAFDPSGTRMYFSSQRNPGTTYEISGPFRSATSCGAPTFVDVPPGAYFADAVEWAVCNGITTGTSASTFSPDATLTRAQMATFLWRYAGEPAGAPAHGFSDVVAGIWYDEPVKWLADSGITSGTGAGTFSPNAPVTRAQMAVFLHRYSGEPAGAPAHGFSDVAPGIWYDAAVAWMVDQGITQGTGSGSTFSPSASLTRAQAVTFLWRHAGEP